MSDLQKSFSALIALPTPLRKLEDKLFIEKGIEVWLKEDHLTHPQLSGNKFRKLKFNLLEARRLEKQKLLSFGGAYSNHIHALAAAGKLFGFETMGIIRGEELNPQSSPTLQFAASSGMKLEFVSRTAYRNKSALASAFSSDWYIIPEGGSNGEALPGCAEMVDEILEVITPSHICTAAGTGGTAAGIFSNRQYGGKVEVFPVLKNGLFLKEEITHLADFDSSRLGFHTQYHFGGYAKYNSEFSEFIEYSEHKFNSLFDQVYTGKLLYGVTDLIVNNYFPEGSRIVIYHSGGLQGKL